MAPTVNPGEPRQAPKPQPLGNFPLIILFTTCTCCVLFLLWRRASSLRTVVAHKLTTWTRKDGQIRLSIDDGPPAHEFLQDDFDEDRERITEQHLLRRDPSDINPSPAHENAQEGPNLSSLESIHT
ncbi:hypothetical protein POSPLADRAFT_1174005 [Postia placenta MAD-698-R-SB12]|uniref:Uncharacterized protein n=1 Tax=Postia placenta MAD-698-R-SB12 TaxID=670580 RepID=A0A1X6MP87_9APHY|nr:hypothetical protein POSPLADRAFT_1174005 [Postia placenta MAD-698-R-SB12]OSX58002.1 hypothetical protein POSPLADRAFT_1174005 [Postia placenta MAD-698-R-SB12]